MAWSVTRTPDRRMKGVLRRVSLDVGYVREVKPKPEAPVQADPLEKEIMEAETLESGANDLPSVEEILASAESVEFVSNDNQITHGQEVDPKGAQEAGSSPEIVGGGEGETHPAGKAPGRRKGSRKARAKGPDGADA